MGALGDWKKERRKETRIYGAKFKMCKAKKSISAPKNGADEIVPSHGTYELDIGEKTYKRQTEQP